MYDCIMSLIGEVHKPSLTPPLFIKVSVLSQESGGVMYMCARDNYFVSFSGFSLRFWNCSDRMLFCFSLSY